MGDISPDRRAHFVTLTTTDIVSTDRLRRDFVHRYIRRLALDAQRGVGWFYVIEPHADGQRYHVHALLAHTESLESRSSSARGNSATRRIEVYDPQRGAADYVSKYLADNPDHYDLSRRPLPRGGSQCRRPRSGVSAAVRNRKPESARGERLFPRPSCRDRSANPGGGGARRGARSRDEDRTQRAPTMRIEKPDGAAGTTHERRRALAGADRGGPRGSRSRRANAPDHAGRFGILEGAADDERQRGDRAHPRDRAAERGRGATSHADGRGA